MMFAPDPAAGASPADLELGSSYGVMLLSTIIVAAYVFSNYILWVGILTDACRMFGFTVLQTLYYYEQFPKDPLILKLSVSSSIHALGNLLIPRLRMQVAALT